jgi:2C-methyl-D-erythritol 2,4-cyclodiphosphate synthase
MRGKLAGALGLGVESVSVKGKTNEGMGWVGRGEGLACIAVVTLARA